MVKIVGKAESLDVPRKVICFCGNILEYTNADLKEGSRLYNTPWVLSPPCCPSKVISNVERKGFKPL